MLDDHLRATGASRPAAGTNLRPRVKVLLVEDNQDYAESVRDLLDLARGASFHIEHVSSLSHAVEAVSTTDIDVILLDLSLPDACGQETVATIQSSAPSKPIVVLSGLEDEELAIELVSAGAQDYIVKGNVDVKQLTRALRYAIERKQAEQRLKNLAESDSLTGLANRVLFEDRLSQALARAVRHEQRFALMLLDVDRFKLINDTLGHDIGDELLRQFAQRLKRSVRESDTVSRLGGDEFTVILEDIRYPEAAASVATKMLEEIRDVFEIRQRQIYATSSIGIAIYPDCGLDAESLKKKSDAAMYRAKRSGRDRFCFFTEEMEEQTLIHRERERALSRALEQKEFQLYYQPQLDLATGKLAGVEALLRWLPTSDPNPILPDTFIPLAEETGLIVPIGAWVLRAACHQHVEWIRSGVPPCRMSVNISPRQLSQDDLPGTVESVLAETGMNPHLLDLELTETVLMDEPETTARVLHELTAMGCHLSLDDFGTGFCSLSYLKHLPLSALKMDRSFVRNIDQAVDSALARTIVNLAHTLNLRVVAEGVETSGQLSYLREIGSDEVQGFLIGRPICSGATLPMLRTSILDPAVIPSEPSASA